jgi:hypothetical protein
MLDTGCSILDTRFSMLDTRYSKSYLVKRIARKEMRRLEAKMLFFGAQNAQKTANNGQKKFFGFFHEGPKTRRCTVIRFCDKTTQNFCTKIVTVTGQFFLENEKVSWYSTNTEIYRTVQEEDS